jgi:hypothetical protein
MVNLLELKLGSYEFGLGVAAYQRNLLLGELGFDLASHVVLLVQLVDDVDSDADYSYFDYGVQYVHVSVLLGLRFGGYCELISG